jgi:hypothetical protein
LQQFPTQTVAAESEEAKLIDLVAIRRSRVCSKRFDIERKIFATANHPEDIHNMLWVEWIDGIAYRCAGGGVDSADWESLKLEDLSLVLG